MGKRDQGWIDRGSLDLPASLEGFRLVHDPLRRRTYIVGGLPWLKCLAGLTCRGGDRAEAFDIGLQAWGSKLGDWSGSEVSRIYARTLRDYLLVPTSSGFTVYKVPAP